MKIKKVAKSDLHSLRFLVQHDKNDDVLGEFCSILFHSIIVMVARIASSSMMRKKGDRTMMKTLILTGTALVSTLASAQADTFESCLQYTVKSGEILKLFGEPDSSSLLNYGVGASSDQNPIVVVRTGPKNGEFSQVVVLGPSAATRAEPYWANLQSEKLACADDKPNWYSYDLLLPEGEPLSINEVDGLSSNQQLIERNGKLMCRGDFELRGSKGTYAIFARVGHTGHKRLEGRVSSAFIDLTYKGEKAISVRQKMDVNKRGKDFILTEDAQSDDATLKTKFYRKDGKILSEIQFMNRLGKITTNPCSFKLDDDAGSIIEPKASYKEEPFQCSGSYKNHNYTILGASRGNRVINEPNPQITLTGGDDQIVFRSSMELLKRNIFGANTYAVVPNFSSIKFKLEKDDDNEEIGKVELQHLINDRDNFIPATEDFITLPCSRL